MIKTNTIKLLEQSIERFQQGGFVNGDYVNIKKNITNTPYYKDLPQQTQDYIKNCIDTDLRLRVSAIKSIRPAIQPVDGGMNAANGFTVDIVIEYAPGLYKNPLTLPVEFVELISSGPDGFGTLETPDSLVYKNNVHGPEESEKHMLPKANTKLPYSNKHPDDAPGGVKKGLYAKDHKAGKRLVEDSVELENVYDSMIQESQNK